MPDLALGALIAGLSAILGGIVTGFITYRNTKAQVKGSLKQLSLKLEHDEYENRRDRLVEARIVYLKPLRDIISDWNIELVKLPSLSTALYRLIQSTSDSSFIANSQVYKDSIEFNNNMRSLAERHDKYRGQISDTKLSDLINNTIKVQGEALLKRTELLNSMRPDMDFNDLKITLDESNNILSNVQLKLMDINKRIEELLCGDN